VRLPWAGDDFSLKRKAGFCYRQPLVFITFSLLAGLTGDLPKRICHDAFPGEEHTNKVRKTGLRATSENKTAKCACIGGKYREYRGISH
jgi:hypothetical protein